MSHREVRSAQRTTKRRTRVVVIIFPNDAAITRLGGAVLSPLGSTDDFRSQHNCGRTRGLTSQSSCCIVKR